MKQHKDSPQEPRHFWINETEGLVSTAEESIKNGFYTHVIEFSVYESLQSKLEKAEAEVARLQAEVNKLTGDKRP